MPTLVLDVVSKQLSRLPGLTPLFKSAQYGGNVAAGTATALAVSSFTVSTPGSGTVSAAGSAAGVTLSVSGYAPALSQAAGAAAGTSTATSGGSYISMAAGAAAGSTTVVAAYSPRLRSTVNGAATVTGVGSSTISGSGTLAASGAASGTSTVAGTGALTSGSVGAAAGAATVSSVGGQQRADGLAAGVASVSAVGVSLVAGMGDPLTSVSFAQDIEFAAPRDTVRASVLQDTTVDNYGQVYYMAYFGGAVKTRTDADSTWTTLRTISDVTEASLAYDNRGWPVLAYVRNATAYVSWKNDLGTWVDVALGSGAAGPFVARAGAAVARTDSTSVSVVYLQSGFLYVRNSYDNYSTATQLAPAPATSTRVTRAGMSTTDVFLVELDGAALVTTAVTTDLATDTLYAVASDEVFPMFHERATIGVWRSKRFVLNGFPAFGWGRLEGPFDSAVMRVYADGVLRYETPEITNTTPFRLPAGRCREIEVEIEGQDRVTGVTLATTSNELEAA